jgi:UrcA family protein
MKSIQNRSNTRTAARALVLVLSLGSALALSAPGAAKATDAPITVGYQDLNLSQPADTQVLYRRLRLAAAEVCPDTSSTELARRAAGQRCYNVALQQAVQKVNAPQLLSLYRADMSGQRERG